jgi:hypothetical protein
MGQHKQKPKLPPMSRRERQDKTAAYHEACHAVIALALGLPVAGALILPQDATLNVRAKGLIQSAMSRGLDIRNAGGITLVGGTAGDLEDLAPDVMIEEPGAPLPESVNRFIPPILVEVVAPTLWELQTDFIDKHRINVDTHSDASATKNYWEQLPQDLYNKYTNDLTERERNPKPCENAIGVFTEVPTQEPFPFWYAFQLLRLPGVQKAIAAIGGHLLAHHYITGDLAEDLTLQAFEIEIARYKQGPVDDFKHELGESYSPLFFEILRIDRLFLYDDIRNNVRSVKASRLRARRERKRYKAISAKGGK